MTATIHRTDPTPRSGITEVYDAQALGKSGVIKATAGTLLRIMAFNASGATKYLQVFDSATVPADAAIPSVMPIPVPAGGALSLDTATLSTGDGVFCPNGLAWACSSTAGTKTLTVTDDLWVTAWYE